MGGTGRRFSLRFPPGDLRAFAAKYEYAGDDQVIAIGNRARNRGYVLRSEFLAICAWKSPRSKSRCAKNSKAIVEEATRIALGTREEQLRIGILTVLSGVGWPTASVILHLAHMEPYPILDHRALWSLQVAVPPQYTFDFWWAYARACRSLARREKMDMRTLDRALWQFSKEKQR